MIREKPQVMPSSHSFIRSVGVLMSGTVIAHSITALALPVLSRLYSPADFSVLAVFSGLLSVLSVAACLRFDIAIPIPDNDTDAVNVLALALNSALLVSVLIAIPLLLMPETIANRLNQPILQPYLWLLPPSVLLAASSSALQSWFVRKKKFSLIASSRVSQSVGGTGTQVGLGFGGIAPLGLLVGYIMNTGAACIVLGYDLVRAKNRVLQTISLPRMRAMAVAHHRFPKYSTLESLSNSAAIQVPIIIIAAVAVGPEAGYLMMAISVMQAPMALVGVAVGQIYISQAPDEYRAGKLGDFTSEIVGRLLKAGIGPLLFAAIVSPVAFPFVFGEVWRQAGQLIVWMTPWFIMQFIASPISMALHVIGHQRTALYLQIFGLITRVATVWIVGALAVNWVAEAFAISGFVAYLAMLVVVLRAVSVRFEQLLQGVVKSLPHVLMWSVIGTGTVIVFHAIHRLIR